MDLFIGHTNNALCPVVVMLKYLAVQGFDEGPLFSVQGWTHPQLVGNIADGRS